MPQRFRLAEELSTDDEVVDAPPAACDKPGEVLAAKVAQCILNASDDSPAESRDKAAIETKGNRAVGSCTPSAPSVASGSRVRGHPLTQEVISFSTNVLRGNLSQEEFNKKLTHLQIQDKRIGPDLEGLRLVPGVYVLYAYDNVISSLAGIENLRRLQQLFLQNNRIASMAGLEGLSQIRKLHLGHNRLSRIDSLEGCTQLEELSVPHQHPGGEERPLQFCPDSLAAIAPSLNVLNAAGNHLQELEQLAILRSLTSLDLSENKIAQAGHLRAVLAGDALRRLNLSGNPFASAERRYRTAVVLCSNTVEEIDGKEILPQERDFVRRLDAQKRKLSAQRKRHLNRVTSDGRPRPPNMSDKADRLAFMTMDGTSRTLSPI